MQREHLTALCFACFQKTVITKKHVEVELPRFMDLLSDLGGGDN